jgi:hypothetical protein
MRASMSQLHSLCQKVGEMLGVSSPDPDQVLSLLGIDSLNVVELILLCQEIYPESDNLKYFEITEETTLRMIDKYLLPEVVAQ